jgi:uncharacterized protein (DUF2235 family)
MGATSTYSLGGIFMALYAFDGTWNSDKPNNEKDTNVVWVYNAYNGKKRYWAGVGTRFGVVGKFVGGITGAGGHDRIREGLVELTKNFAAGDTVVDIVGFSRGAAIAVDFANEVAKQSGLPGPTPAKVRFLGVYDVVASFDIPGDDINLGFNFKTPPTADHIVHCMALDERRLLFPLTRMSGTGVNEAGHLQEVWFRGVHSDVGGGDDAPGLSSIALNFMFNEANLAGLPIDPAVVRTNAARMNPDCPICLHPQHVLETVDVFRQFRVGDVVHESVTARVDQDGRHYNNPPTTMTRVSESGTQTATA